MRKEYKPTILSDAAERVVEQLKLHVRDMFPTAEPGGHDWQHVDSQMTLWRNVGGSILEEDRFRDALDPFLPCLYIPGHDLDRLPVFEPKSPRALKKSVVGLAGEMLQEAALYNARIDDFNARAELRITSMYDGFLQELGVSEYLRDRVIWLLTAIGGKNKPDDPADLVVCSDLDKAIVGPFYAWRCGAVGAGQRVKHVVKRYLFATPPAEDRHKVIDEKLESWVDDLKWAEDWDPCAGPSPFVIRSAVLHEIADPGFDSLRRIRHDAIAQLRAIGYKI